jgi:predicted ATPase
MRAYAGDIPIIIYQPEENLDNQTIFKVLVKCIKAAKQRRQVIMVTHNPNLAVVCDAEQIIFATCDKATNTFTYISGGIESPAIKASRRRKQKAAPRMEPLIIQIMKRDELSSWRFP